MTDGNSAGTKGQNDEFFTRYFAGVLSLGTSPPFFEQEVNSLNGYDAYTIPERTPIEVLKQIDLNPKKNFQCKLNHIEKFGFCPSYQNYTRRYYKFALNT